MQLHIATHVTVYQSRTPDRLRGRVVGTSSTLAGSMMAVGALVFGVLGSWLGMHMTIAIVGIAVVLATALVFFSSDALRLDGASAERELAAEPGVRPQYRQSPLSSSPE
jgi:hypothetical protein